MIIQLNPDWRLNSDKLNWILQHRSVVQEGKTKKTENIGKSYWRNETYHGTIDSALMACAERMIRFEDVIVGPDELTDLLARLDALTAVCTDVKASR